VSKVSLSIDEGVLAEAAKANAIPVLAPS